MPCGKDRQTIFWSLETGELEARIFTPYDVTRVLFLKSNKLEFLAATTGGTVFLQQVPDVEILKEELQRRLDR